MRTDKPIKQSEVLHFDVLVRGRMTSVEAHYNSLTDTPSGEWVVYQRMRNGELRRRGQQLSRPTADDCALLIQRRGHFLKARERRLAKKLRVMH